MTSNPPASAVNFAIVGVGASAGGLEAFTELLQNLPPATGMAFVLVQHLDPHHESILAQLLAGKTSMPVLQAGDDMPVAANHVYIIPPNTAMEISQRRLKLKPRSEGPAQHLPIDTFLTSLARDVGSHSIGVVLSGSASDGTLGLKAIKSEGGITFAQDESAAFDSMPRNAIAAGVVDFVLPPKRIAQEIASIAVHPYRQGEGLVERLEPGPAMERLMTILRNREGVDFTQYKQPTITRRLSRRMVLRRLETVEQYLELLQEDPREIDVLFDDLLINVTDFFRDPHVFDAVAGVVFPALLKDRQPGETIRVWVPGCSTGEEVYSVAIALREFLDGGGADFPVQMFGTDVSEDAIEKARAGVYNESAVANVSAERRRRFFSRTDSGYQIQPLIREMCIFSRHNLAKDPPLSRMDLISCRNLLIYFAPILQKRVIATFGYALQPAGCLILGTSESLGSLAEFFSVLDEERKIYCRKPGISVPWPSVSERTEPFRSRPEVRGEISPVKEAPASRVSNGEASPDQLANELNAMRQYLQTIIEELRSTNEEAQSANEELQSTNEELQTAKEELQSSNEELNTVNAEMQSRNSELVHINDDLTNLFASMNMPIVMMGNDLRIRRFTPMAAKVLHLIPTDVGRAITDLRPRIDVPNLEEVLLKVLETLVPDEREVRDEDGGWYLMRIRPYRTAGNRIDGAVLQLLDVGELKATLDEVRQARDYAQAIVDTVREPLVVLDGRFAIRNANNAFYEFAGLHAPAAEGRVIFDFTNRNLNAPAVHGLLNRLIQEGTEIRDAEVEYDASGEKRAMSLNASYLKARNPKAPERADLILLAFEDVTERKRAAEARYRRLFESAGDGIVILDAANGEITDINPFVEKLSGYRRDEIVGRKVWELDALRGQPEVQASIEQLRERGVLLFPEVTVRTKEGRVLEAEVLGNVYSEGERRAAQLNIRDLTERRKFERDLRQTQKLESLGLLAGGIAHDFNNLLTGIMGNASLVYSGTPLNDPSRKYLREIVSASERAAFLTKQLLAYAGRNRPEKSSIDLGELVSEIATLIGTSIPKTVEVRLNPGAGVLPVMGDPGQIQQIVMNLVINGAEAIGEGVTGRVEITTAIAQLSEEDIRNNFPADDLTPGRFVRLEVKDTGAGMDDATRARIFDPFFTTKFTGRGLGLAAVLGIVRGHKGAIRVYSSPGQGSSFQVWLPAADTPAVRQSSAEDKESARLHGVALVVDDEPVVRDFAADVLKRSGLEILRASNGKEAVELFRNHKEEIKVVVLDLLMPSMGGGETLEQIAEILPGVPVIISSGLDVSEARLRFKRVRPAGFLQKPYKPAALIQAVRSALENGRRE